MMTQKKDIIEALRTEFEKSAYPHFKEIERERIGVSNNGCYTHRFQSNNGHTFVGIIEIKGLSVNWYFSTAFPIAQNQPKNDKRRNYALFYENSTAVITYHSLKRYNERTLNGIETSIDRIFHKYVEKLMDYALISKSRSIRNLNMFMRVNGGAFLSNLILNKKNYWFKTYISDKQMFANQMQLSDALDHIELFQESSSILFSDILTTEYKGKVSSWINGDNNRKNIYINALEAAVSIYENAPKEDLDQSDIDVLAMLKRELWSNI